MPTGVGTSGIVPLDPSIEGVENVIFNSFVDGPSDHESDSRSNNTYGLNDNFSKVVGDHTLKAGFQGSYEQVNVNSNPTYNGSFLFAGTETGLDFADFLIGVASNYNQADSQTFYLRHKYAGAYGQDSWRIRPNLTLNYGVRWELMQYWSEKFHQEPTFALGQQSQVFTTAPAGLVYPGDKGIPRRWCRRQTNFRRASESPGRPGVRVASCINLSAGSGNTSIRAGYGMFYSVIQGQVLGFDLPQPPYGLSYTSPGPPLFAEPFRTAANGSFTGKSVSLEFPPAEYQHLPSGSQLRLFGLRADRRSDGPESTQHLSLQRELLPLD